MQKPTSLIHKPSSLIHETMSSINETTSPKYEPTLSKYESKSTIYEPSSPIHDPTSTISEPTYPIHELSSPLHELSSPLHKPSSLLHETTSLIYEPTSLIHQPTMTAHELESQMYEQRSSLPKSPYHEATSPLYELTSPPATSQIQESASLLYAPDTPLQEPTSPLGEPTSQESASSLDEPSSPLRKSTSLFHESTSSLEEPSSPLRKSTSQFHESTSLLLTPISSRLKPSFPESPPVSRASKLDQINEEDLNVPSTDEDVDEVTFKYGKNHLVYKLVHLKHYPSAQKVSVPENTAVILDHRGAKSANRLSFDIYPWRSQSGSKRGSVFVGIYYCKILGCTATKKKWICGGRCDFEDNFCCRFSRGGAEICVLLYTFSHQHPREEEDSTSIFHLETSMNSNRLYPSDKHISDDLHSTFGQNEISVAPNLKILWSGVVNINKIYDNKYQVVIAGTQFLIFIFYF